MKRPPKLKLPIVGGAKTFIKNSQNKTTMKLYTEANIKNFDASELGQLLSTTLVELTENERMIIQRQLDTLRKESGNADMAEVTKLLKRLRATPRVFCIKDVSESPQTTTYCAFIEESEGEDILEIRIRIRNGSLYSFDMDIADTEGETLEEFRKNCERDVNTAIVSYRTFRDVAVNNLIGALPDDGLGDELR